MKGKMRMYNCEKCGEPVTAANIGCRENELCEVCLDKWEAAQIAYWYPLYLGEKQAGLLADEEDRHSTERQHRLVEEKGK